MYTVKLCSCTTMHCLSSLRARLSLLAPPPSNSHVRISSSFLSVFAFVFVFLLPFVFVFEVFEICLLHQPSFMYQSSSQLLDPHFKFRNWIRINSCHCHQGPDQGCHFETVSTTAVLESDFHFIFATL